MSEKPTIAALRAWLKSCPLIAEEQEATGAVFRIAGLDEDATAFSIEDSPGDPVITKYFSGRDMAKNYLFLSRREYGEADVLAIQNSGFFEQLTDWVLAQNDCHHLPALEAPRHLHRLHRHQQRGQLPDADAAAPDLLPAQMKGVLL